ncbi:MAG TPA: plastocyanin/azurin family copper-binding protein [Solirubrobacterales bacterium]|nr:plastocyanin/azurin family copper-binding protein [Solirubrobacterales bacterium]
MRRASALIAVSALLVLGLAACGGDDDDDGGETAAAPATTTAPAGGGGGGSTVDISTPSGSDLAFEQSEVNAKAGPVTIDFDNQQAVPHDVKVEDSGGEELGGTDLISSSTANATVDLQPGSYTFFCSVPGHREAGMEGTLTVK